jgi:hypothetical protein
LVAAFINEFNNAAGAAVDVMFMIEQESNAPLWQANPVNVANNTTANISYSIGCQIAEGSTLDPEARQRPLPDIWWDGSFNIRMHQEGGGATSAMLRIELVIESMDEPVARVRARALPKGRA